MEMTINEKCYLYGSCKCQTAGCVVRPDNGCPVYRYFKDLILKDYENRLKTDMVAMLTDIQLEIEEKYPKCDLCEYFVDYDYDENDISEYRSVGSITDITNFIQQKINALKENGK